MLDTNLDFSNILELIPTLSNNDIYKLLSYIDSFFEDRNTYEFNGDKRFNGNLNLCKKRILQNFSSLILCGNDISKYSNEYKRSWEAVKNKILDTSQITSDEYESYYNKYLVNLKLVK